MQREGTKGHERRVKARDGPVRAALVAGNVRTRSSRGRARCVAGKASSREFARITTTQVLERQMCLGRIENGGSVGG